MNSKFISIVIPAYNEGGRIESTLAQVVGYLSTNFSRFEVVVVDDGSTDDTAQRVALAAAKEPRVRLLSFPDNRGKGFAVRQGVLAARGAAVFFTDADLSTPVEEIEKGIEGLAEGSPAVIASRRHPESVIAVRQGWLRETVGRAFNLFVRALLSVPSHDTQCGFKGFDREAAQAIFSRARIDGFAFDVEILVIAQRLGYRIKEIPVRWTNSADSKVRPARQLPHVVGEVLKIYLNDRQKLYGPRSMETS